MSARTACAPFILGLLAASTGCAPLVHGEATIEALSPLDRHAALDRFGSGADALQAARIAWEKAAALNPMEAGENVDRQRDRWREARDAGLAAALLDPRDTEGLMMAARAGIALGERPDDHRGDRAQKDDLRFAVRCARLAGRRDPDLGAAPYLEGVALGHLARLSGARGATALREIRESFERAAGLDPDHDRAGPLRALGLFYLRAPAWPTGPGDADLAVETLEEAVRRVPGHPPNRLALAEALREVGRDEEACREARAALEAAGDLAEHSPRSFEVPQWRREAEAMLARCDP
jgi:tetratricopeptide (TPR) repeat protein